MKISNLNKINTNWKYNLSMNVILLKKSFLYGKCSPCCFPILGTKLASKNIRVHFHENFFWLKKALHIYRILRLKLKLGIREIKCHVSRRQTIHRNSNTRAISRLQHFYIVKFRFLRPTLFSHRGKFMRFQPLNFVGIL